MAAYREDSSKTKQDGGHLQETLIHDHVARNEAAARQRRYIMQVICNKEG